MHYESEGRKTSALRSIKLRIGTMHPLWAPHISDQDTFQLADKTARRLAIIAVFINVCFVALVLYLLPQTCDSECRSGCLEQSQQKECLPRVETR